MGRSKRLLLLLALGGTVRLFPVRARDTLRVASLHQTARSQQRFLPGAGTVQVKDAADDRRLVGAHDGRGGRGPGAGLTRRTGTSHANDDNFHGRHVASTIAEATNSTEGVAGLAFGCALMPVKVLDNEGNGSFFDVADGIDFATNFTQGGNHPVKV